VIGNLDSDRGWALAYDAIQDSELGLAVLRKLGYDADRCRPLGAEQSNSSLVYDERLILKLYRRLHPGRNRDVETTLALADAGFDHVARPLAGDDVEIDGARYDLSVLQPYLSGGVAGCSLALTSLRDLLGAFDGQQVPELAEMGVPMPPVDPAQAGGDFSAEARRLGAITADMHVALAHAFGTGPADASAWADSIDAELATLDEPELDAGGGRHVTERLREIDDAGPTIRAHGDYHLGQVLRTDEGWFVLDFEGEPDRPPDERNRPASPLRDVAGMLRSLHYAARVALVGRGDGTDVADAWEARNRRACFEGYTSIAGEAGLLPPSAAGVSAVLAAFELEKALYELRYERDHRPEWAGIPVLALERLGLAKGGDG